MLDGLAAGGLPPSSIKTVLNVTASSLRWAEGHRPISHRATTGDARPNARPTDRTVLTVDEAARMFKLCRGEWSGAMIVLGLTTGMRRSELIGLRWRNVLIDRTRATGSVREIEQLQRTRPPTWSSPKGTRRAIREVDLPPVAIRALLRHQEAVSDYRYRRESAKWPELELVFPSKNGTPASGRSVSDLLTALAKRAGIDRHVCLHDLRHTFATRLLEGGATAAEIRQALGHEHLETTVIYLHSTAVIRKPLSAIAGAGPNAE